MCGCPWDFVITLSPCVTYREYKVYDLRSYDPLYRLSDTHVQEVKISPGIMLVIHTAKDKVPLKILNIEDGTVLKVRRVAERSQSGPAEFL